MQKVIYEVYAFDKRQPNIGVLQAAFGTHEQALKYVETDAICQQHSGFIQRVEKWMVTEWER